jgi:hypothetical protein
MTYNQEMYGNGNEVREVRIGDQEVAIRVNNGAISIHPIVDLTQDDDDEVLPEEENEDIVIAQGYLLPDDGDVFTDEELEQMREVQMGPRIGDRLVAAFCDETFDLDDHRHGNAIGQFVSHETAQAVVAAWYRFVDWKYTNAAMWEAKAARYTQMGHLFAAEQARNAANEQYGHIEHLIQRMHG